MNAVSNRIPPEVFDRARHLAAQERTKAITEFFAGLLKARQPFADIHYRFHRRGLWCGI